MRRELAERLLAQIMEWSDEEKAEERQALEAVAAYKYDEYQQFAPGLRFLESLALWLRQFKTVSARRSAYQFVRSRLVFISRAEMSHLVELAFPTFIRPHLMAQAAGLAGLNPVRVKQIVQTTHYHALLRKTLILGLSDGAMTDQFRRANASDFTNEQIWLAYDVSKAKAAELGMKLKKDLKLLFGREVTGDEDRFETVVLLDDFTASGTTYLREDVEGEWEGKIAKIIKSLDSNEGLGSLIVNQGAKVIIVIYVAAPQAIKHLDERIAKLSFEKGSVEFRVVHRLSLDIKLDSTTDADMWNIAADVDHFDEKADDGNAAVGGHTMRYGYADCRLPVVLSHNTPNNSIFLLWAGDVHSVHGLFPRVPRHRMFE